MLREVKLYGHLGKRFGKVFRFDVASPAEASAALRANLPGFEAYMCKHNEPGYHVLVDNRGLEVGELLQPCGRGTIKIIPAVQGAKRGGVFQTIVGAVVTAVGYFVPGAQGLIPVGLSMMAGGVIQMLTKVPSRGNQEKPENTPNYSFNGPVNTTSQGNPVPVTYGEVMIGSQVISMGLSVDSVIIPSNNANNGAGAPGSGQAGPGLPVGGLNTTIAYVEKRGSNGSWSYENGDFVITMKPELGGRLLNSNAYVFQIEWNGMLFYDLPYDPYVQAFYFDGRTNPAVDGMAAGQGIKITAQQKDNWTIPSRPGSPDYDTDPR